MSVKEPPAKPSGDGDDDDDDDDDDEEEEEEEEDADEDADEDDKKKKRFIHVHILMLHLNSFSLYTRQKNTLLYTTVTRLQLVLDITTPAKTVQIAIV